MSKKMVAITAQRKGNHAATQQHSQLGTNLDQRVDIFQVIRDHKLWLMFQPFDKIYGTYLKDGQNAGIILNSNHPPNLQRYTAAHEYGHYVMGHEPSIDDIQDIEQSSTGTHIIQELEAQAFAAYFLMPLRLINLQIAKMRLSQPAQFTAHMVYQLSLRLGVSYSALVQHLVNLGKIKGVDVARLQRQTPKTIKAALGRGITPQNSWADVWSLGLSARGESILLYVDDEVHIHLPEDSLSNERWHVDTSLDQKQILLVREERLVQLLEDNSVTHTFIFRMLHPGHYRLRIIKFAEPTYMPTEEPFEIQLSILSRAKIGLNEQQSLLRIR